VNPAVEANVSLHSESPVPGDVLILPDDHNLGGYTLAVAPDGPSQLRYASYDEALKAALRWAAGSGVAIWRANGEAQFKRIQAHES
jgi:hypothetical protein